LIGNRARIRDKCDKPVEGDRAKYRAEPSQQSPIIVKNINFKNLKKISSKLKQNRDSNPYIMYEKESNAPKGG
jgi:hypothetical protein